MFYYCCPSLHILIDFSRSSIVLSLFRCLSFRILSDMYCILSFIRSLILFILKVIWFVSFLLFTFGIWLIIRYLCLSRIVFIFIWFRSLLLLLVFSIVSWNWYIVIFIFIGWAIVFNYYIFWIIINFDVFCSNFRAVGIWGFVIFSISLFSICLFSVEILYSFW